jgi:hypothetical protein
MGQFLNPMLGDDYGREEKKRRKTRKNAKAN